MDAVSLTRLHWRLRGAWMWPSFIVLALLDGAISTWRPLLGDSGSAVGGWILGVILSLIAIAALSPPLGWVVRKLRTDMPKVVARDYAGAGLCVFTTLALLAGGIANHGTAVSDQNALEDATARAEAYIGDHAPQQFMANLHHLSTYELQPPEIYRTCATNQTGSRDYCVVVNRAKPFGKSVRYDGSESNTLLSQGTS